MSKYYNLKGIKEFNPITRFLWFCAGADSKILKDCTNGDHVKYACVGGIVLGTALLAGLSMTFAMSTIFPTEKGWNVLLPLIVGIGWGLLIFNLDRFIVASTGKGDGKESISWSELKNASPRLAMAIIIGLTISAPLETYMFGPEIKKQFYANNREAVMKEKANIENAYKTDLDHAQEEINKKREEFAKIDEERKQIDASISFEIHNGGCHDKCEEFKRRLEADYKPKLAALSQEIDALQAQRQSIIDKRDVEIKAKEAVQNEDPGFLEKILTLEDIPGASIPLWLIRMLFMVVEITPVLFKLMMIKSPYDYLEDNIKELRKAEHGIKVTPTLTKDAKGREYEGESVVFMQANQELAKNERLLEALKELGIKVITTSQEHKSRHIDDNPDLYNGFDNKNPPT